MEGTKPLVQNDQPQSRLQSELQSQTQRDEMAINTTIDSESNGKWKRRW